MKTIYLAGPDVFRENALEHFKTIKSLCTKHGFEGLSPFDNENFDGELFSKEHSKNIFLSNVQLIKKCDIVIANLIPFRGACVDDGTSWEIAYAYSLNKIIYGYTSNCSLKLEEITKMYFNLKDQPEFPNVEKFGNNCVNLMLQESIESRNGKILASFEDCLIELKEKYYGINKKYIDFSQHNVSENSYFIKFPWERTNNKKEKENLICPCCKSDDIKDISTYDSNGIIGPGCKTYKLSDVRSCNKCGVIFRPIKK